MPRYQTTPHDKQGPFSRSGAGEGRSFRGIETTYADDGERSSSPPATARERSRSATHRARWDDLGNSVSRKIIRKDYQYATNAPVYFAVHKSPVYTLLKRDGKILRAYWPELGK
jgi:hypothetical protein